MKAGRSTHSIFCNFFWKGLAKLIWWKKNPKVTISTVKSNQKKISIRKYTTKIKSNNRSNLGRTNIMQNKMTYIVFAFSCISSSTGSMSRGLSTSIYFNKLL